MRCTGEAAAGIWRREMRDLDGMRRDADAWDALERAPLSPNPFYSRNAMEAFALSGAAWRPDLRFACIFHADRLVALLPVAPRAAICGWRRATAAYASPFTTLSTPLVARDAPAGWADELLASILGNAPGSCLVMPRLAIETTAGAAMLEAARRSRAAHRLFDAFARPVATPAQDYAAFAQRAYGKSRRKSLRRLRNGLAALGVVSADALVSGFAEAVENFLALERSGWKGRRGTSLADDPNATAMARTLFSDAAAPGARRIDRLLLDGRPVAMSMSLVQDGVAVLWKTAFDESLRRFAPGIVLEDEIVARLHEEPGLRRLDSCATGPTALDDLYDERETIADLVICSAQAGAARLAVEAARRRARRLARNLRARLRWRPG
ncbi:MAG: GNAT family N-acetyltransferase [Salinarimonadaceae bacterium]|nr:MAG: GNAT family N-acetyltransferase [Salinarimonadaceae bacterium]